MKISVNPRAIVSPIDIIRQEETDPGARWVNKKIDRICFADGAEVVDSDGAQLMHPRDVGGMLGRDAGGVVRVIDGIAVEEHGNLRNWATARRVGAEIEGHVAV